MTALVLDADGGFATLAVVSAGAGGSSLQIARSAAAAACRVSRGFADRAGGEPDVLPQERCRGRLVSVDARRRRSGADVPAVDHVVGLAFDYFGDPQPPRLLASAGDGPRSRGRRTARRRPRPASGRSGYPPGENCVFARDGAGAVAAAACRARRRHDARRTSTPRSSPTARGVPTRRARTDGTPTCSDPGRRRHAARRIGGGRAARSRGRALLACGDVDRRAAASCPTARSASRCRRETSICRGDPCTFGANTARRSSSR